MPASGPGFGSTRYSPLLTSDGRPQTALRLARSPSPSGPGFDLWPKPEPHAALSQFNDWSRHIGIPVKVGGHAATMRQAENLSDELRVDQIFTVDLRRHDLEG